MITELRRMYLRRSLWWTLGAVALLPLLLVVAIKFGDTPVVFSERLVADLASSSGMNFAAFCALFASQMGMLLLVGYFFGEAVARDAEWGTLRTVLTAPVHRVTLIARKGCAAGAVTVAVAAVFGASTLLWGTVFFGPGDLSMQVGDTIGYGPALARLLGAFVYLMVANLWLAALGLLVSVLMGVNGLGAVALTVLLGLASHVLGALPFLGNVRAVLPTRNYAAWLELMSTDMNFTGIWWGTFLSVAYFVILTAVGIVVVERRNIRV